MTTVATPSSAQVAELLDRVINPTEAVLGEAQDLLDVLISALEEVKGRKDDAEELSTARFAADELDGVLDQLRSLLVGGGPE